LRSTRDNGLEFQAWVAAHESKVAHRIFRLTMAKGRAYETMEDWEAAQKEYQSLQSIDVGDGNPCKFTNEQKALLLSRLADCATTRGDLDKALSLYTRSRSIDRRAPGIHRKIASVYQSQGDVELAQAAVSVALAHEAPWDGENTTKNADMYFELSTENLAQQERRKQEEAFYNVWGEVLTLFESFCTTEDQAISWSLMKEKEYDMVADVSDDESETSLDEHDTTRKVQAAQEAALLAETDASETEVSDILSDNLQEVARDMQSPAFSVSDDADVVDGKQYDCIKLTKEALKNLKKLDEKYKEFFTRRVEDLASGRRSRIMAKGLKGCKNVRIFETYLEQKSGFRILWTADDKNGLVIWYVVEHKKVSKYMKMIDEADERASRRLTSASSLSEDTPTLLDPRSDTPLKVYNIPRDQIKKLESDNWKPRLHLTKEEKSIVETDGTVLLLGRSGTG
jgi:tetratricopeptide (TPR) repeat protein